MANRSCLDCAAEFAPGTVGQRKRCPGCAVRAQRAAKIAWRRAHPGYSQTWRDANRDAVEAYNAARRAASQAASPLRTARLKDCKKCSAIFLCPSGRQFFTCAACRKAKEREKNARKPGRSLIPKMPGRLSALPPARRLKRPKVVAPKFCVGCEAEIVGAKRRKCGECLAVARREARHREKRRLKSLKSGVAHESYTLEEIAKRDNYRCGFCGGRVAMARRVPHPKAPTRDHILPRACGGDDTRANVQLAHFICNSTAGARGGDKQLMLVG